jgi:hypothetical protein
MIRFLFRFVGLLCLAAAFIFVVYDGMKSIADQGLFITRAGDIWNAASASGQQLLQNWLVGHGVPWLWDPVALQVIAAPAWLALVVVGAVFMMIGRKKRPLIGYARG